MELYSILLFFFGIGAVGIWVINRKYENYQDGHNRWMKYFVYLILVFGQQFLINEKHYEYFAILIVLVGCYEIIKIKKSIGIGLISFLIYSFVSLFFVYFFIVMEVKWQQFLFIIVITFDGYSQLSGQLFGKTKLFPTVSPNKTWEGLLGGIISTIIISSVLGQILDIQTLKAILFGLIISLFSVAGDFLASYYKRINRVKDYSNTIPQHGGFLDRFDSLIVAGFGFFGLLQLDFSVTLIIIFISYVLLFLLIFATAEMLYHVFKCKVEISRKIVHITSGMICLSFPFYIHNHWVVLSLCLGFVLVLFISQRFCLLKSINDIDRKSSGSILFPISVYFCFVSFQYFNQGIIYFYLPILILSVCDPLAALVGKKWAFGQYKVGEDRKTLMGSMAFFVSCFAIFLIVFYFSPLQKPLTLLFLYSYLVSVIVTLVEAFSRKGYDNVTIPLSVLLCLLLV